MIDIKVEAQAVLATFRQLMGIDYINFLKEASETGVKFVKEHFDKSESPDGQKWEANKGHYVAWKKGLDTPWGKGGKDYGDKPLILLGELREAIYSWIDGNIGYIGVEDTYHSEISDFPWGSTSKSLEDIGKIHEYGLGKVVARPFMGLGIQEVNYITSLLNRRFDEAIK